MTTEQYRCLIAHMMFWKDGLDAAIKDVGITSPKDDVIYDLWKCGWIYSAKFDRMRYVE
jgi:hypothetical protein